MTTDEEAWNLAIQMTRASNEPVWVNNVDRMLAEDGLEKTGKWASYQMQFRSLKSAPWVMLPCDVADGDIDRILAAGHDGQDLRGQYVAAVLRKRMQRYGVSPWHPDPERALAEANSKS
jgi:hypothetical protein